MWTFCLLVSGWQQWKYSVDCKYGGETAYRVGINGLCSDVPGKTNTYLIYFNVIVLRLVVIIYSSVFRGTLCPLVSRPSLHVVSGVRLRVRVQRFIHAKYDVICNSIKSLGQSCRTKSHRYKKRILA